MGRLMEGILKLGTTSLCEVRVMARSAGLDPDLAERYARQLHDAGKIQLRKAPAPTRRNPCTPPRRAYP